MGQLSDAIREHLELKRRHGASEDDLAKQEAEALGPVRRRPDAADRERLGSDLDATGPAGGVKGLERPRVRPEPRERELREQGLREWELREPGFREWEPREGEALEPDDGLEEEDDLEIEAFGGDTPPVDDDLLVEADVVEDGERLEPDELLDREGPVPPYAPPEDDVAAVFPEPGPTVPDERMSPDEPPPIGPRPLVDEAPVVHDEPLTDEDEARVVGEEASLDLGDEPDALPVGPGPLDHAPFPTSEPPVGDAAAEPSAEAPFPTHASHPTDAPLPAPPSDPTDAPFPGRGHDPADEDPSLFVDSLDPLAREAPDMGPEAAGGMDPLATQPHGVPGLSEEEDEDDDEALGAGQPALLDEDELAVFEEEHEDPPAGAVPPALDDESDEALLEEDSVVGGAYEDPVDEDVVGADEDYADEDTVGSGAFEDPVDEAPDFLPEPEPERRPASPPRDPDAFDFDA